MEQFQIPMGKSWIQDRSMEQFQIPIGKSYKQNRGKIDTSNKHIHTAITIILINKVWCFTSFSVISWGQFYWWRKLPEYPEKTTDPPQVTDKLYLSHNVVSSTPRRSEIRI
jgi:hypothetical protein